MIYGGKEDKTPTINIDTPIEKQNQFVLNDEEVKVLSKWALLIEEHYKKPMDIEWLKMEFLMNYLLLKLARNCAS